MQPGDRPPAFSNGDEAALVQRAQKGDAGAFEKIVKTYSKRIYGVVYRMTSRHDVAEDLGQEAFVRFWRSLERFDSALPVFPFLRKIAVNLTLNYFASRAGQARNADAEVVEAGATGRSRAADDPVENLMLDETRREVAAALAALTPERRMALTLRLVEGLSYEAIAEAMDCEIGTVMSRLYRARAEIKERLEGKPKTRGEVGRWQTDAASTAESAPIPL